MATTLIEKFSLTLNSVMPPSSISRPNHTREIVYVADNDPSIPEALAETLTSVRAEIVDAESVSGRVAHTKNSSVACVVMDLHLSEVSGFDLQRRLDEQISAPVIFTSAIPDVPATVRAMRAGAIEILMKPVDPAALVTAIRLALLRAQQTRQREAELALLRERYSRLTPRECEILPLVVGGLLNKESAAVLQISEITLQIHRRHIMQKMQADSLAELVRMAVRLRIPHWRGCTPGGSTIGFEKEPRGPSWGTQTQKSSHLAGTRSALHRSQV